MKFKDYIFTIFLSIVPFTLLLTILKFLGFLNINLYTYLIYILTIIVFLTLIICSFYVIEDIREKKDSSFKQKIIQLILMTFFSLGYIPIYYTKYFIKNEEWLGYLLAIFNLTLVGSLFFTFPFYFDKYMANYNQETIVLNTNWSYLSKDNLFTIQVDKNYSCSKNLGEYAIACDNQEDNSFVGIYNYSIKDYSLKQLKNIRQFHINQTKKYIIDAGFKYQEENREDILILTYNKMAVLIKTLKYDLDDNDSYQLVIIKEVGINDRMLEKFNDFINGIEFINHNN